MRRAGESGASLVEYALLLALIFLVALAAVRLLGGDTGNSLDRNTSTIRDAATTVP